MTTPSRHNPPFALLALAIAAVLMAVLAPASLASSPLPSSDYTVRHACPPPAPGRASCMALQLVPRTPAARAHTHPLAVASPGDAPSVTIAEGAFGLTPSDLHSAYELPVEAPSEQTIALVDSYDDPTAESDLKSFDEAFGLPACTHANGCFKKVNQRGEEGNLPIARTELEIEEANDWGLEISLDIETAHAICQLKCKILLVEANSPSMEDLESAERAAESQGATEISNSYGGPELGETPSSEASSAFNHPKTVITASAGDYGYLEWDGESPGEASFPASSPHVVAVGGTRLTLNVPKHTWRSETVWNDGGERETGNEETEPEGAGGGGCSRIFEAQPWQSGVSDWASVGCGDKRAVADVAADADPVTGVGVYYSSCESYYEYEERNVHWCSVGGTSLASPIIASNYALAGGAQGVEYPAQILYENAAAHPVSLHDVIAGSNGECLKPFDGATGASGCKTAEEAENSCSLKLICLAHAGYDGPTGVGTPRGISAFQLAYVKAKTGKEAAEHAEEEQRKTEAESQEAILAGEMTELRALEKQEAEKEEARRAEELRQEEEERRRSGGKTRVGPPISFPLPATSTTPPAAPASKPLPPIAGLSLSLKAIVALSSGRPRLGQVGFSFNLNVATETVRVALAKKVRIHKHTRWQDVRHSLSFTAKTGPNSHNLVGHNLLTRGLYRLTVVLAHGGTQTIDFQIG
jgi:hypothetical protein